MSASTDVGSKIQLPLPNAVLNLLLAIAIFYNAELGKLMGIQDLPLPISVVWLATGCSLAALLLFGTRVWIGIFLGNFVYNFTQLYAHDSIIGPALASSAVAIGSLLQALLGNWIIRKYCTINYFNNVKDILIFLFPAGLFTCLCASTIGTATLFFYGSLPLQEIFNIWLTFWIGDTLGVYVLTPLLVIWILFPLPHKPKVNGYEILLIVLIFVCVTIFNINFKSPPFYLYLPLSLWSSYRFGFHGATLLIFCIAMTTIMTNLSGYWHLSSVEMAFSFTPLMALVVFLEITVGTSLLLAALVNERGFVLQQLTDHNIDLRQAIQLRNSQMKKMHFEISFKEKLASRGLLTASIARQIQFPLQRVSEYSKTSIEWLKDLKKKFRDVKIQSPEIIKLNDDIKSLENSIDNIVEFVDEANRVAKLIETQSTLAVPEQIQSKSISINNILLQCLQTALQEAKKLYPSFNFTVIEELDKNLKMILVIPDDLAQAFFHLISNAIFLLHEKKLVSDSSYRPTLKLITMYLHDEILIEIHFNGLALNEKEIEIFYSSLIDPINEIDEIEGNDLTTILAHDIITYMYNGEVIVESQKDEFFKITILLPKS